MSSSSAYSPTATSMPHHHDDITHHTVSSVGVEVIDMSDGDEPQTIWYNYSPSAAQAAQDHAQSSSASTQHATSQPHGQSSEGDKSMSSVPGTSMANSSFTPHRGYLFTTSSSDLSSDDTAGSTTDDHSTNDDNDMTDPSVLLEYLRDTINGQQSSASNADQIDVQPLTASMQQSQPYTSAFRSVTRSRRGEAVPSHLHRTEYAAQQSTAQAEDCGSAACSTGQHERTYQWQYAPAEDDNDIAQSSKKQRHAENEAPGHDPADEDIDMQTLMQSMVQPTIVTKRTHRYQTNPPPIITNTPVYPTNKHHKATHPITEVTIEGLTESRSGPNLITPQQVTEGTDIQSIPWNLMQWSREEYRDRRVRNYSTISMLEPPSAKVQEEAVQPTQTEQYTFANTYRNLLGCYYHFQLRHLLKSSSHHNIYAMSMNNSLIHYNTLTLQSQRLVEFEPYTVMCSLQVSIPHNLLFIGGLKGEILIINLLTGQRLNDFTAITESENGICNSITLKPSPYDNEPTHCIISDNDSYVRTMDIETLRIVQEYQFDYPVNYTVCTPDGKQMVIAGDASDVAIIDSSTGEKVMELAGHTDYSFSCSAHPNGYEIATASQDCSAKVWDLRYPSHCLHTLGAKISPVRSCTYTADGRHLALAEAADFVYIYDTTSHYQQAQTIECFGEISGIDVTPDSESLYIGVTDRVYGCLLEYNRKSAPKTMDLWADEASIAKNLDFALAEYGGLLL